MMRIYDAVCDLIEAGAEYLRSGSFEREFENADWTSADTWRDEP